MGAFSGFPAHPDYVAIPRVFFSDILPQIDDLAELQVTLHLFRLIGGKRGYPRAVSLVELQQDRALASALVKLGDAAMSTGLTAAVERKTFLRVDGNDGQSWLLLNTLQDRRAAEELRRGSLTPTAAKATTRPVPVSQPDRDIFTLYEESIGPLSPIIAERLEEAEREYPAAWVLEAFQIAAEQNHRSWRYVEVILQRWQAEGKDDGTVGRRPPAEQMDYSTWLPTRRRKSP